MNKSKLQSILAKLSGGNLQMIFDSVEGELKTVVTKLQEDLTVQSLEEVNRQFTNLKKTFVPLTAIIEKLRVDLDTRDLDFKTGLNTRLNELNQELSDTRGLSKDRFTSINEEIIKIQADLRLLSEKKPPEIPDFAKQIVESEKKIVDLIEKGDKTKEIEGLTTALEEGLKKLRQELIARLNEKGGGNMNRQVYIGGADPLTKYTDINWKAGSNVTLSYQNNDTTKKVDITVASSGGGGSTRSINSIAINTNAGSASGTDYVYLCSGTLTITMPTTVGNTNLYTIKNIGAGIVTIATIGGETIDGSSTIVMPVQFTSVDLVSNNSGDWAIT